MAVVDRVSTKAVARAAEIPRASATLRSALGVRLAEAELGKAAGGVAVPAVHSRNEPAADHHVHLRARVPPGRGRAKRACPVQGCCQADKGKSHCVVNRIKWSVP